MALLPMLPMLLLTALFGTLALRLVRSGVRSNGPEGWLGGFFGFIAASAPLRASAAMGVDIGLDPALANLLGQGVTTAGIVCLNYFVWRVFRDDGRWGRVLFFGLSLFAALQMILFFTLGGHGNQSHPVNMLAVACMMLSLAWAFGESLNYWRMLRRRRAIGLGDEVIANRFGLWTLWTGALLLFPIFILGVRILAFSTGSSNTGVAISGDFAWAVQVARALIAFCGPTVAICTWLIFFPPRRYLTRIAARGAESS
jgi:hypothetical protein